MLGPLELLLFSLLLVVGGLVFVTWTLWTLKRIADRQDQTVTLLQELVQQTEEKQALKPEAADPQNMGPTGPSTR